MSEENTFDKTTDISIDKLGELIDDYGTMKLSKAPVGVHLVAKIIEPIKTQIINEGTEEEFVVNKVKVQYEPKGYEAVEFIIQVGTGPVKRLIEKHPDDSYVGMLAYFKRTKYQGKYPQHINVFEQKQGDGPMQKPVFLKKKNSTGIQAPAPTKTMNDHPEFVKEIIAHFCENPQEFQKDYMQATAREGVTAPWEFVDSFNEAAKKEGVEYAHDEIIKIYHDILRATMENRA